VDVNTLSYLTILYAGSHSNFTVPCLRKSFANSMVTLLKLQPSQELEKWTILCKWYLFCAKRDQDGLPALLHVQMEERSLSKNNPVSRLTCRKHHIELSIVKSMSQRPG
jgi:hypothetical protein